MNNKSITLYDESGREILFDIVYYFYHEDFDKSYVLLTPSEEALIDMDEEEATIYPYSYTLDDEGNIDQLFPIETDEEWEMIEAEIESLNEDWEEEDEL